LAGIITSAVGLVLARIVAPLFTTPALMLTSYLLGITLAIAGLGIIVFGLRRKSQGAAK